MFTTLAPVHKLDELDVGFEHGHFPIDSDGLGSGLEEFALFQNDVPTALIPQDAFVGIAVLGVHIDLASCELSPEPPGLHEHQLSGG